jgi:DNA (cytosine-5)-methyltransferase 1
MAEVKDSDRDERPDVLDLFCGAGGLSYGFESAGYNIVAGIDKEEDFIRSFGEVHDDARAIVADLSSKSASELLESRGIDKNIDIILGGPPCQGFSTVGDREEEDERNKLITEFAHALEDLNPSAFVMENVTGLRSMENEDGNLVIEELKKLFQRYGYEIKFKVLKATDYGVPQKRKRLFIVGMQEDIDEFEWPDPTHVSKNSLQAHSGDKETHLTVNDAISDLPDLDASEKTDEYDSEPESDYQEKMRENSDKLFNHKTPGHSETVLERLRNIPQGGNHADLPEELQLNSGYSNIYGRLDPEKPADTITGNYGCVSAPGKFIHPEDDRALTVREGARLQSFPDHYRFYGNQSQQYKQVGNAVPPLLAKAIAEELKKAI